MSAWDTCKCGRYTDKTFTGHLGGGVECHFMDECYVRLERPNEETERYPLQVPPRESIKEW